MYTVDLRSLELLTSSLQVMRSTNWATSPLRRQAEVLAGNASINPIPFFTCLLLSVEIFYLNRTEPLSLGILRCPAIATIALLWQMEHLADSATAISVWKTDALLLRHRCNKKVGNQRFELWTLRSQSARSANWASFRKGLYSPCLPLSIMRDGSGCRASIRTKIDRFRVGSPPIGGLGKMGGTSWMSFDIPAYFILSSIPT